MGVERELSRPRHIGVDINLDDIHLALRDSEDEDEQTPPPADWDPVCLNDHGTKVYRLDGLRTETPND